MAPSVSPRHEAQGSDYGRDREAEPDGLQDNVPQFNQDVFHTSKASVGSRLVRVSRVPRELRLGCQPVLAAPERGMVTSAPDNPHWYCRDRPRSRRWRDEGTRSRLATPDQARRPNVRPRRPALEQ